MKLYTEEQVKRAIDISDENPDLLPYDEILSKLEPIELPSDEEIIDNAPDDNLPLVKFIAAAKWVIEQIKQQADGK